MGSRVALCVDDASCRNPELVGLDGEALDAQSWLEVFSTGLAARSGIGLDESIGEVWVVSSDDVEPINLAATLKADRPDLLVRLVAFESCGSLFSRAHTALIDEVLDKGSFAQRYADAKRLFEQTETAVPTAAVATVLEEERLVPPALSPVVASMTPMIQPTTALPLASSSSRAFLMPVVSGSGGAGKSSVSAVGAFIARSMGFQTLLLDYDLQFGDVAVMAGVENPLAIDELLARPELLERELRRDPGLAVLAAPTRLEAAEEVVRTMPRLLEDLSGRFDVIIANTGAAWAEQHAVLLERCSTALFLVDQRSSSVRACRHALELCARCGIASGPFQFAVNRCSKNAPLTSIDVSCALQGAPVFELKDGGRDVEDFLGGGAAAEFLETRNEFCESLRHVLGSLLPGAPGGFDWPSPPADERRISKRRARHAGRKRG